MKKISVVIPCKDDPLITKCVNSIQHEYADVTVVFNGSSKSFINQTQRSLKHKENISYTILEQANLAWALETGTRKAKNDAILYMDSDCIFSKDAIKTYWEIANTKDLLRSVYKGDVVFSPGKNMIEKIIAKSRTHHTAEVLTAYKPPLLISRKIASKIGGYCFDNRLIWREDSDFDNRIRKANIKIMHVVGGDIHHKSISLKTDLRSTFRYGIGLAIANHLNIKLTEVPRSVASTLKSQGILPAIYMIFRNRVYDFGYLITSMKFRLGILKLAKKPIYV